MDISNTKPRAIDYPVFADDRGIFAPVIDGIEAIAPQAGNIKRVYYVYNYSSGTIRGFHYHAKEWKFFVIVQGSAKFIAINPDNPEEKYELYGSSQKNNLVIVPPRYANGWMSLEDRTILVCASNLTTKESLADDTRFDPYKWGDPWSIKFR